MGLTTILLQTQKSIKEQIFINNWWKLSSFVSIPSKRKENASTFWTWSQAKEIFFVKVTFFCPKIYDSIPSITLCSNEYNYNNLNQINFIIIIKSWSDEKVIQSWLTRGFCHSYSDHLLKLPAYITIHSSLSLRLGWSNIQYLFSIWNISYWLSSSKLGENPE